MQLIVYKEEETGSIVYLKLTEREVDVVDKNGETIATITSIYNSGEMM